MMLPRRRFLHLAAGAALLSAAPRLACAQGYPVRPVRIIVGLAPGGPADILARLIGQSLSERLGQPFVVENRLRAGSNIAAEMVANAPADGYTLLMMANPQTVNASLYKLKFDVSRDIAPVAGVDREPFVVLVHPSLPATAIPDLIAYAKANPRKLNVASAGNGTASHVSAELFKMMAGVDLVHVPYRGGAPALTDLIAGQVQVTFLPMAGTIEHIKSGKVRALAVTTTARSEVMPTIPTVSESLPGYESSAWFGLGAPKATPADIVDKLNTEVNAALADAKTKARLAELGGTPMPGSPADFSRLIGGEIEKWGRVVRFAGMTPE
jgi:tripartite-type tricarboxylate transporter receptor subunit TctC